jgi:hypothetical protein
MSQTLELLDSDFRSRPQAGIESSPIPVSTRQRPLCVQKEENQR